MLTGKTIGYVREDIPEPVIAVHHCPQCGATTHWIPLGIPLGNGPHRRMGVNARLMEDGALDCVEVRHPDGLSW